jgi:hypothetical protein
MKMATMISTFINGNISMDHESFSIIQSTQDTTIFVFEMFNNGLFAVFTGPAKHAWMMRVDVTPRSTPMDFDD